MYDFDPRDPWDWTDYVRFWSFISTGMIGLGLLIYFMFISVPAPIQCCQCCCP